MKRVSKLGSSYNMVENAEVLSTYNLFRLKLIRGNAIHVSNVCSPGAGRMGVTGYQIMTEMCKKVIARSQRKVSFKAFVIKECM